MMDRRMQVRGKSALIALAIVLAALAGPPSPAQVANPTAPPYEAEMLRLSEIMGALHYLRRLCDGATASRWRDEMEALIDAEQPDGGRRARMIDRFNRGYESYRSVYRACTPSAQLVVQRYLDEGARIAVDIGERYAKGDGE